MKEPGFPPRLAESSSDPRLANALDVAKSYEPTEARIQRALVRFEATRASRRERARGAWRPMFWTKAGVLAAIALASGVSWTVHHASGERPSQASSAEAPKPHDGARAESATPSEALTPSEAKTMGVEELPAAAASANVNAEKSGSQPVPVATSTAGAAPASFDDELALVEAARTSLAKGDGAACLAQLDQYDRRVRGGVFGREVAVMRIEALLARGDSARARALGEAFLAKNPESPYATRIRSLLSKIAAQPARKP